MAIFLDHSEREYLKELLKKNPSTYWVHDHLLEKVIEDEERLKRISRCKHEYGEYEGKNTCCMKCGTHDVGMGEEWTLITELKDIDPTGTSSQ
jgi:hypothetical protein